MALDTGFLRPHPCRLLHGALAVRSGSSVSSAAFAADATPLPSWNDGSAKGAIIDFVKATTDKSNARFVPAEDRVATFDQDGTTWVSHPIYSQVLFAFDRVTTEAFQKIVKEWMATAKHSRFGRPYSQMVYQPMLEVMRYLRDNGYKTYIVTGGGQEFVRAYAQKVYGIPPGTFPQTLYDEAKAKGWNVMKNDWKRIFAGASE